MATVLGSKSCLSVPEFPFHYCAIFKKILSFRICFKFIDNKYEGLSATFFKSLFCIPFKYVFNCSS